MIHFKIKNRNIEKYIFTLIIFVVYNTCLFAHTKVDILVIGGGASGTTATIQAARMGVKVLLIEETNWLGGMLTSAGVSAVDGNYNLPSGLFGEFKDSLINRYGSKEALQTGWVSNILFEPSIGCLILKNIMAKEKKAIVWYNTTFVSAKKKSKGWQVGVLKQGKKDTIYTQIIIDATELGDVAKYCGIKYDVGMEAQAISGEDICPTKSNNIIQDITFVAILKDFGEGVDKTISKPKDYLLSNYACCSQSIHCNADSLALPPKERMMTYGKLPNQKYMINWPIGGNDYYLNMVEMTPQQRAIHIQKAKSFTLGFVYYLQTELGYTSLGLADDEFPTADLLPFIPYHRESRRIHGLVRFNIHHIQNPFTQKEKLYRTGIAVGDYPVDHHHNRYQGEEKLPHILFPAIPSYSLPMGVLLPQEVKDFIVAEKSISVSNIVNGTTRLQPVVMQIGQAAGIIAALAITKNMPVDQVPVRAVQNVLLHSKGYIMPYLDVDVNDKWFIPLQKIGATGILKGVGKNVDWSNQTWFRYNDTLKHNELEGLKDIYPTLKLDITSPKYVTLKYAIHIIKNITQMEGSEYATKLEDTIAQLFQKYDIKDNNLNRPILRKEMALLINELLDPFNRKNMNIQGQYLQP